MAPTRRPTRRQILAGTLPAAAWASLGAPSVARPLQEQDPPATQGPPLRLALAGLVHGHVHGMMGALLRRKDVTLVGVFEPDAQLREQFRSKHGLDVAVMFADLDALIATAKPEAIAAYTSTRDHRRVIEQAADSRIHVMVEKPLAVSTQEAAAIAAAAARGGVHVLVNYETTWYRSHRAIWELMHEQRTGGTIRKIVALDGHAGPMEIGVQPEFLAWLRDPVQNGAGALFDFGCYGATLMTWLFDERRPRSVTALTQRFKPAIYPDVDDEASILLDYGTAQGIVQASWNWPFNRKDLEVYTEHASAVAIGGSTLRFRPPKGDESTVALEPWPPDERDALSYLSAVVRGRLEPSGPSGLSNNMIVVEILEAARESARTGRTVTLAG